MPSWIAILISGSVPVVIAIITGAIAWGWFKNKVEMQDTSIKALRSSLFQPDSTLVYIPAVECDKRRTTCDILQTRSMRLVCSKMDEVKMDLKAIGEKRKKEAKELSDRLGKIEIQVSKLVGIRGADND